MRSLRLLSSTFCTTPSFHNGPPPTQGTQVAAGSCCPQEPNASLGTWIPNVPWLMGQR